MTDRDEFAKIAMGSLLTGMRPGYDYDLEPVAARAYEMADLMLRMRDTTQKMHNTLNKCSMQNKCTNKPDNTISAAIKEAFTGGWKNVSPRHSAEQELIAVKADLARERAINAALRDMLAASCSNPACTESAAEIRRLRRLISRLRLTDDERDALMTLVKHAPSQLVDTIRAIIKRHLEDDET